MNMKKKLASLMAVVMTAAVVALPHAAYADEALTVIPKSDNITLGRSASEAPEVISSADYSLLAQEEQAMYVKYTAENSRVDAVVQMDSSGKFLGNNFIYLESGSYVKKGAGLWISAQCELYVGRDIVVNGEIFSVVAATEISNFGNRYDVGNEDIVTNMIPRAQLTDYEKQNFIPITHLDEGVKVYKLNDVGGIYKEIQEGDYINLNKTRNQYLKYAICAPAGLMNNKMITVCGVAKDFEINNNEAQIWNYDNFSDFYGGNGITEFTVKILDTAVLSPEFYSQLPASKQSDYVRFTSENKLMFCSVIETEGYTLYYSIPATSGDYVRKGAKAWIGMPAEKYIGHDILVNGEVLSVDTEYGIKSNIVFEGEYTVGDKDFDVSIDSRPLTDWEKENYIPVVNLNPNIRIYKLVNMGPAAVQYNYIDSLDYTVQQGDYISLLKNHREDWHYNYVIRVSADLLKDDELVICGKTAEYFVNNDNDAQIWNYYVPQDAKEFSAILKNADNKSSVSFDPNAVEMPIFLYKYVDEYNPGIYLTSNFDGAVEVPVGTELFVSCHKYLMAGKTFTVNGNPVSTNINGEDSYFVAKFTADSKNIVIGYEKKAELSEYEKENFVPFNIGDEIIVKYYPDSDGDSGDENHINYFNGDFIAKGLTLKIGVSAKDYTGKKLMINNVETQMVLNGDGDTYLAEYIVPSNVSSVNITLENVKAPDEGSEPNVPSQPSVPQSPAAPVISTGSNNKVGGTSAVSNTSNSSAAAQKVSKNTVVRNIKRSGRASISYDAKGIGITNDVLKAFADNKKSKTLTANFDNLSIVINKSDITDKSKLSGVDIKVSSKKFISNASVKKTKALAESKKVMQLNISGGKLDGIKKVTVKAIADKSLSGRDVTVYEYKDGKLTTVGSAKVDKYGNVSLTTDHLGQFVIAVK